ncbi:HAD family hydrolase [Chryseobacterium carnipullorum]|uniref:Flavin mononucleotide phosphatase n=1 Tax=Chryseobacterium carnipullorum TaxID=1124835 RepID=A0A1M7DJA6_CHRCU|nr:HAD family hydrolase [Chryseobacterium carnipullorum]MDN5395868.1 HAD family hydrolase [Chryseobacterium sp.]AZA50427.1 HAD family hydrolase [Chryseobacterium carnipullorum]AZA65297.1 HAD family hydrolase [Chryseobacterium carnipullorum]MDN5479425.1 HAD family hydrolase [Chryseobacterium sp.]SHL79477.1 putative hydrolase of the HAD superfamily [Chryseobacterium carnipullorum]
MNNHITTIAFDADDTLWINEPYFQEAEKEFCVLLEDYLPQHSVSQELFKTEMQNLHLYGYGVKGFMLCMIETVSRVSGGTASMQLINRTIEIGQELLQKPIELLDGVTETLDALKGKYRLVVATKGDLLDQERKLKNSGLQEYFHHIEIMSDKKENDYQKLLKHLDCRPEHFLMLGNSIKSDILPVLEIGGFAAHIPYHVTWSHEQHESNLEHENFMELKSIDEVLKYL